MISRHKELHTYLNSLDFSKFYVDKKYSIESEANVRKHARHLGTEFERVFKSILCQINPNENTTSIRTWIESDLSQDNNQLLPIKFYYNYNTKFDKNFNLNKFLKNYNFQKSYSYGIDNENDKKSCQKYLSNILLKINFEKFKAKKIIITDLVFKHTINGAGHNLGYIDLIIDNKIIDIKTDIKISAIPKSYISQLLYYFIFIKYIIASN